MNKDLASVFARFRKTDEALWSGYTESRHVYKRYNQLIKRHLASLGVRE